MLVQNNHKIQSDPQNLEYHNFLHLYNIIDVHDKDRVAL